MVGYDLFVFGGLVEGQVRYGCNFGGKRVVSEAARPSDARGQVAFSVENARLYADLVGGREGEQLANLNLSVAKSEFEFLGGAGGYARLFRDVNRRIQFVSQRGVGERHPHRIAQHLASRLVHHVELLIVLVGIFFQHPTLDDGPLSGKSNPVEAFLDGDFFCFRALFDGQRHRHWLRWRRMRGGGRCGRGLPRRGLRGRRLEE